MPQPREVLSRYLEQDQLLLNRYRLKHMIGEGSYGAIFKASDLVNGEIVAVKALPPSLDSSSHTALGRFQREMSIIKNLVHPNIVALFDYGETPQGVPFMVMEFVQGKTLEQHVRHNPMDFESGLDVFYQIASALAAAHQKGVIHRDLKPANIMVQGEDGHYRIKMLDFGMAKVQSELGGEAMVALTREGMAVGTPRYIAPEQARGQEIGPYTDLYALGLLGYEIFTGIRVVNRDDIEGAVQMHVSPEPLPLPELHKVPAQLRPILKKLMQKNPVHRYLHAEQLLHELDQLRREVRMINRGGLQPPQGFHPPASAASRQTPAALDIDYEKLEQAQRFEQSAKQAQEAHRQQLSDGMYTPITLQRAEDHQRGLIVYFEFLIAPVLALSAFTLMACHIQLESNLLRGGVCAFPLLIGALAGWLLKDKFPIFSGVRTLNITSILLFVVAHLMGISELKTNLMLQPAWYLRAFKDVPGLAQLYQGIEMVAHRYVEVLSTLF